MAGAPRLVVRGRWKDERGRVTVLRSGRARDEGGSGHYDDDEFDEEHPFADEYDEGSAGHSMGGGMAGMSLDDAAKAVSHAEVEPPYPARNGAMAVL